MELTSLIQSNSLFGREKIVEETPHKPQDFPYLSFEKMFCLRKRVCLKIVFLSLIIMPQIKSYRAPKVEVKESLIGGKGIFAKEDIKKGELVFIKSGHIVGRKEAQKYDKEIGDFSVQITDEFFLCPTSKEEVNDIVIFFNHSCNPNIGPDGQISFVAIRDIKAGEELVCDYSTFTTSAYKLECKCGTKFCRKIITGDDWKLLELQKRYGDNFSWFILKKIKKLN